MTGCKDAQHVAKCLTLMTMPTRMMMNPKTSQFLTDVVTAAGLLSHGKRDKNLAERIGAAAMEIRLQPEQKQLDDAYSAGRADERLSTVLACIDIVAMHGGSVEIEAAMRKLLDTEHDFKHDAQRLLSGPQPARSAGDRR
jgi:hypothetical protein